jgi:hypothetical protein
VFEQYEEARRKPGFFFASSKGVHALARLLKRAADPLRLGIPFKPGI